ncbi:hypothetical protein SAMN05421640_2498 [Ekhidna lutea]|uniref:Uncharacterized protein n=1 Tax=Ekhidna lutea TaxID=447679 RepID=A0A239K8P9_EKHLU|nr:hypothetical protein [Ekhidna lutea]SNT14485.1 hypothetical protein SAMN05421640_2498 [Ekhidna lutea]
MKYIVFAENVVCQKLADILINELKRFDVRSEIKIADGYREALAYLKDGVKPDLLLIVGTNKSSGLSKTAKKYGIRCCYFYQSLLDSYERKIIADKIYYDVPSDSVKHVNLLSDFVKSTHVINDSDTNNASLITICYCFKSDEKRANKLLKALSKQLVDVKFRLVNPSEDLEKSIIAIQKSNMTLSMDQLSNILSVFTNSPTVNVFHNSLFSKSNNTHSIINRILNKEVVSNYSLKDTPSIAGEVLLILKDHQQSASMLGNYQDFKSLLGTQHFARESARDIIEWLEE